MSEVDVIVIGSGAGGLAVAVALANNGKRVLVLEQHYMAGGWTHSFVLEGYKFSPGVHYIGKLGPGEDLRAMYDGLGVSGDLEFCKLNEDGFEHVLVGDRRFDYPVGEARFVARLQEEFPQERKGIKRFVDLLLKVARQAHKFASYKRGWKKLLIPFKLYHLLRYNNKSLRELVDRHIKDPMLKTILLTQAGDYALPPSKTNVLQHALLFEHYVDGGYYPRGGGHRLPRAFVRQLKRKGGQLRLSTGVKRILLEEGRAVGVELEDGEQIKAGLIVSNADPHMTFTRLVGEEHLSAPLLKKLKEVEYSVSTFSLFMATDMDLRAMGLDSGNYWCYEKPDLEAAYDNINCKDGALSSMSFDGIFLTITTLKDPSKRKDGRHTIEVFGFMPYAPFARWESQPHGERDEEYQSLKKELSERLLKVAERVIPDLSQHLLFFEAGTPLSNLHYCQNYKGSIYGISKIPEQIGANAFPSKTEIPGLWMVGASTTLGHGIMGATASGVFAAAKILNKRLPEILLDKDEDAQMALYPAERPEEWKEQLKQRRSAQIKQTQQVS